MLEVRFIPSEKMTPELCRRLWDLRLRNIRLRSDVDPEDDYRAFESYFKDDTLAVTFWDAGEELRGFYGWNVRKLCVHDQPFVRVVGEYFLFDARHRGSLELALSGAALGLLLMVAHPGSRKLLMGIGYPGTYVGSRQVFERLHSLRSPEICAAERHILEAFAREYGGAGFDPVAGVVKMRTMPIAPDKTSSRPVVRAALADYEALNPRWREGYGLPFSVEVGWAAIRRAVAHGLERGVGRMRERVLRAAARV